MQSNGYDHWAQEESCLVLAVTPHGMSPWLQHPHHPLRGTDIGTKPMPGLQHLPKRQREAPLSLSSKTAEWERFKFNQGGVPVPFQSPGLALH